MTISYDGTDYAGWQRQPAQKTVQGMIEQALFQVTQQEVSILGSGRTDAGVHARMQCAGFSIDSSIEPEKLAKAVNACLPKDIRILHAEEKGDGFHPIGNVASKTYRYFFTHNPTPDVFMQRYVWQTWKPYDLEKMQQAAQVLLGTQDFMSFATHGVTTKTTVRTINAIDFGKQFDQVDYIDIEANGFLRHMVRSIVGTLMDIGTGKKQAEDMQAMIQAQTRSATGITAPAHGLFLWDVRYK